MEGYVTVFTGDAGFRQFVDHGKCGAKIKSESKWEIPIIVPRSAIKYKMKLNDPNGNMEEMVEVDLFY